LKFAHGILILLSALALASCAEREGASRNRNVPATRSAAQANPCVNLNTATEEELMRLPGVGEVTSRRVIEYRARNGPFRRPEEVIIVEGFSEKKYRAIAEMICVE
jgi:competence protein ComEA